MLPQDGFGKIIPANDAWPRVKYSLIFDGIYNEKQTALPSSQALKHVQVGSKRNLMKVTWMCTRLFLLSFISQYIYVVPTEKLRLAWPTFECIRFSHFSRHFGSRYTTHWALFNLTRGRYYLLNTPKKNQLFWLFPSFKIQIECFSWKTNLDVFAILKRICSLRPTCWFAGPWQSNEMNL